MSTIEEALDANIEAVNELINAAFSEGYGTMEVGPAIAEVISGYVTQAIFARTATFAQMAKLGIVPKRPKDGESF